MPKWLEALTIVGFLWGPFFFAILFMLVITRTSHSYYSRAAQRVPPASEKEMKDYRLFFGASWTCGIVLVFIAVGWWMFAQLQKHAYEGVIVGLDPTLTILPTEDTVFLRAVSRNDGRLTDYYFAVVRNSPFAPGEEFRLGLFEHVGDKARPIELVLRYTGSQVAERYRLRKDGEGYHLVPLKGYQK